MPLFLHYPVLVSLLVLGQAFELLEWLLELEWLPELLELESLERWLLELHHYKSLAPSLHRTILQKG